MILRLVVDTDTKAGDIQKIIVEAGGTLLKEVNVFDLYEGEKMEAGKKSIAYLIKIFRSGTYINR